MVSARLIVYREVVERLQTRDLTRVCAKTMTVRRIFTIASGALMLSTTIACDSVTRESDVAPSSVICHAFDERCLPCESAGEGVACEVHGDPGTCAKLRVLQGPQILIAGLRCRAE